MFAGWIRYPVNKPVTQQKAEGTSKDPQRNGSRSHFKLFTSDLVHRTGQASTNVN